MPHSTAFWPQWLLLAEFVGMRANTPFPAAGRGVVETRRDEAATGRDRAALPSCWLPTAVRSEVAGLTIDPVVLEC
jgi:hypothetical protein